MIAFFILNQLYRLFAFVKRYRTAPHQAYGENTSSSKNNVYN